MADVRKLADEIVVFYSQVTGNQDVTMIEPLLLDWINMASRWYYLTTGKLLEEYTLNTVAGTQKYEVKITENSVTKKLFSVRAITYDGEDITNNNISVDNAIQDDSNFYGTYWGLLDSNLYLFPKPDSVVEVKLFGHFYPIYSGYTFNTGEASTNTQLIDEFDNSAIKIRCFAYLLAFLGKAGDASAMFDEAFKLAKLSSLGEQKQENSTYRLYDF